MSDRLDFASPAGRLGWALGLSIALHGALVFMVQARPGGAPSWAGARVLEARIEATPAVRPAPGVAAGETVTVPSLPDASPRHTEPSPAPAEPVSASREQKPDAAVRSVAKSADAIQSNARAEPSAVGLEMPLLRDADYYAFAALDKPPRPLASTDVCFPQGASGKVEFSLFINEQGDVDRIAVASVHPAGLFTGAATDLCSRVKFSPGVRDGRAVRSRVRLVLEQRPS